MAVVREASANDIYRGCDRHKDEDKGPDWRRRGLVADRNDVFFRVGGISLREAGIGVLGTSWKGVSGLEIGWRDGRSMRGVGTEWPGWEERNGDCEFRCEK